MNTQRTVSESTSSQVHITEDNSVRVTGGYRIIDDVRMLPKTDETLVERAKKETPTKLSQDSINELQTIQRAVYEPYYQPTQFDTYKLTEIGLDDAGVVFQHPEIDALYVDELNERRTDNLVVEVTSNPTEDNVWNLNDTLEIYDISVANRGAVYEDRLSLLQYGLLYLGISMLLIPIGSFIPSVVSTITLILVGLMFYLDFCNLILQYMYHKIGAGTITFRKHVSHR